MDKQSSQPSKDKQIRDEVHRVIKFLDELMEAMNELIYESEQNEPYDIKGTIGSFLDRIPVLEVKDNYTRYLRHTITEMLYFNSISKIYSQYDDYEELMDTLSLESE